MTWTAATESNLDFEDSTTDFPGWTLNATLGSPTSYDPPVNISASYGSYTRAAEGANQNGANGDWQTLSRDLDIPADSKRVRLSAYVGTDASSSRDQGSVVIMFFDVNDAYIGGVTVANEAADAPAGSVDLFEHEALVPETADRAEIWVFLTRGYSGVDNQAIVAGIEVDWFIDASFTEYTAPSLLENGNFETGDMTGWTSSDTYIATTGAYTSDGTYCLRGNSGSGELTRTAYQDVSSVPATAEELLVAATLACASDTDQTRLLIEWYDDASLLRTDSLYGATGLGVRSVPELQPTSASYTWVGDRLSIPAGADRVRFVAEFWKPNDGSAIGAGLDSLTATWASSTPSIGYDKVLRIRLQDGTWYDINPQFEGHDSTGLVPDPGSTVDTTKFLREDGTWAVPAGGGGGGGHTISEDGVDVAQRTNLDFAGVDFDVTDDSGNDSTDITLADTAVTSGDYTNPALTVDSKGRVTAAEDGESGYVATQVGDDIFVLYYGDSNAGSVFVGTTTHGTNSKVKVWQPNAAYTAWSWTDVDPDATIHPGIANDPFVGMPLGGTGSAGWVAADTIQRRNPASTVYLYCASDVASVQSSWESGGAGYGVLTSATEGIAAAMTAASYSGSISLVIASLGGNDSRETGGVPASTGQEFYDSLRDSFDDVTLIRDADSIYFLEIADPNVPTVQTDYYQPDWNGMELLSASLRHNEILVSTKGMARVNASHWTGAILTLQGERVGNAFCDTPAPTSVNPRSTTYLETYRPSLGADVEGNGWALLDMEYLDVSWGETDFTSTPPSPITCTDDHTWDYTIFTGVSFPAIVSFSGTHTYKQNGDILGMGQLFFAAADLRNEAGVVRNPNSFQVFVAGNTWTADGAALTFSGTQQDYLCNSRFRVANSGTLTVGQWEMYGTLGRVDSGATVTNLHGFKASPLVVQSNGTVEGHAAFTADHMAAVADHHTHYLMGTATVPKETSEPDWGVYQDDDVPHNWNGAQQWAIRTSSSATITADSSDHVIICSGSSAQTVNLPSASSVRAGREYIIKRTGTGTVTVDGNGSETIDGSTTQTLSTQYHCMTIVCDGSNWIRTHHTGAV